MRLFNPIKISYRNLWNKKFRSFLTILGVIIGVSAVIIIFAVGKAAQELILNQIRGIGSNLIAVIPGASEEDGPPAAAMGISVKTLTYKDLKALRNPKNIPGVEDAAGYVFGAVNVTYKRNNVNATITGTTASYLNVESAEIEKGRYFTENEEQNLARIAVVGSRLANDIFQEENPLGKKLKIKNQNYTVIGVFKERGSKGSFAGGNQDESVFLPLKTAQKLILGINHLGVIRLKAKSVEAIEPTKENIRILLRERHHIKTNEDDDFSVRDQETALQMVTNITNVLRYFLLAVGGIALLVGGVGIMNIMLIAVNQRIKEVGLRKALGARDEDIYSQFLIEAITVSLIGGIIGIILGILISYLASVIVQYLGYNWPLIISPYSIIISVVISIIVGVIFGLYPAKKASQISPMEALRYE
jgi:putative ABC transport system permease protein